MTTMKSKKFYESGSTCGCLAEFIMTQGEFQQIFGNIGEVDETKKKSTVVTNLKLTAAQMKIVFGNTLDDIKTQTYSEPRFMRKQYKTGSQNVSIGWTQLSYSKNTNKCKLRISVSTKSLY